LGTSEILKNYQGSVLSTKYLNKAKTIALLGKILPDLSQKDIDKMPARGMYQMSFWQYRWFVPFDVLGTEKN
jgi:hypothetical protein